MVGQIEPATHDSQRWHRPQPQLPPQGDVDLVRTDRPVALRAGGAGTDQDDVAEAAQEREHLPVRRCGQAAGAPVGPLHAAVGAGDEVQPRPRPVARMRVQLHEAVPLDVGIGIGPMLVQQAHGVILSPPMPPRSDLVLTRSACRDQELGSRRPMEAHAAPSGDITDP